MYESVLVMLLVAGFIGAAALAVGFLLGPKKRANASKSAPYESGIPASGNARERFPVHFYLVAMLFIIFDLETAFFYPLAVKFKVAPEFLFANAIVFVAILAVGYIYILRKGVLRWN